VALCGKRAYLDDVAAVEGVGINAKIVFFSERCSPRKNRGTKRAVLFVASSIRYSL